ncbi:chemotaxis protein CheX [Eubacterium sp. MSJ-13]|nr:chemotaxis protein CheX [Eubacterium sp. MSJ-13]MBU5478225.1 chemotaxis protein CheX [Eubacterium sp. MSJ-13]
MTSVKVEEIFNDAFVSVSRKIISLELHRKVVKKVDFKYLEMVHTRGNFASTIVCGFSPLMFDTIIRNMNGGQMPSEDEKVLYINEYVNIVCGRALSEINNQMGVSSRLTVPTLCLYTDEISVEQGKTGNEILFYETEFGQIEISIHYTVAE